MATLSAKRQRFVEEYLVDLNATQAAIRAGYSARSAQPMAARLVSIDMVKAAIDAGRARQQVRAHMTADEVIRELVKLARANMDDYVSINKDGDTAVDLASLTRDQMAAVNEISYDAAGRLKFKLADKRAALVDLGKHFGIFVDKQTVRFEGQVSHDWTVRVVAPDAAVASLSEPAGQAEPASRPKGRRRTVSTSASRRLPDTTPPTGVKDA